MNFPLKTAIIENEPKELKSLKKLLLQRKDIFEIAFEATEYSAALEHLQENPYQLAIIDIYLDEGKDCYDLINSLGRKNLKIITLTSGEKSVHPARAHTYVGDCLWFDKPYIKDTVAPFIEKLVKKVHELQLTRVYDVPIPGGKKIPIAQDKICFVRGKGNGKMTEYFLIDDLTKDYRRVLSTDALKDASERLSASAFVRIHKSCLFNIHFYRGRSPGRKWGFKLGEVINTEIESEIKIPCSKKYLPELLRKLRVSNL